MQQFMWSRGSVKTGGGGDLKEDREAMKEEEGQEGKTNKDDARRKTKSIRKREKR